jgi:hypothetical protein
MASREDLRRHVIEVLEYCRAVYDARPLRFLCDNRAREDKSRSGSWELHSDALQLRQRYGAISGPLRLVIAQQSPKNADKELLLTWHIIWT